MQGKLKVVGAGAVLIVVAGVVLWVGALAPPDGGRGGALVGASMLVSVATLASIAFAVIVYLESAVLRTRVEQAIKEVARDKEGALRALKGYRRGTYEIARNTIRSVLRVALLLPDEGASKGMVVGLRDTVIDIGLQSGTAEGARQAMEESFKYNRRRFLEIERVLWTVTEEMDREDRERIRNDYVAFKRRILRSGRID